MKEREFNELLAEHILDVELKREIECQFAEVSLAGTDFVATTALVTIASATAFPRSLDGPSTSSRARSWHWSQVGFSSILIDNHIPAAAMNV